MGANDPETDVPSAFEGTREEAAQEQTETPQGWTSPDERRRSHEPRAVGSFTKLLEHDSDTGLLTADGVDAYERLATAIEDTDASELDKLASNIAHARMFGGVHFRSDGERGIRLGEQVAVRFLQDHLREYPEGEFGGGFEFTSRDGDRVRVAANSITVN